MSFSTTLRTVMFVILGLGAASTALGAEPSAGLPQTAGEVQTNLDYVWTVFAAMLVFFMQAGFALVESGFSRARSAVNIIMKNVMDASAGVMAYFAIGFGLMFGTSWMGIVGTDGFFLMGTGDQPALWTYAFWLFQSVFAATAATIVSGAVTDRIKFGAYLAFTILMTSLIYPVFGAWAWGGLFNGSGWLESLGFIDFAGSTVVHSIGGWAALAGAIVVGPRVGKYADDGTPREIPGHSLPLAALGVFILWLGWFGFNAGSTTAGTTAIAKIAMNTFAAAGAGAVAALAVTWGTAGTPDPMMTLNGVLSGLVAITAGCAALTLPFAILTGAVAGAVMVYATRALEQWVDDPVGAIAVHGVCGAWGTIAAGLFQASGFSPTQVAVQFVGVAAAFLWSFPVSYLVFTLIDETVGLRITLLDKAIGLLQVDGGDSRLGLDRMEHDVEAYPEFQMTEGAPSETNGRATADEPEAAVGVR